MERVESSEMFVLAQRGRSRPEREVGVGVGAGLGWLYNHRKKQAAKGGGFKNCSRLYCITEIGGGCVCYLEKKL